MRTARTKRARLGSSITSPNTQVFFLVYQGNLNLLRRVENGSSIRGEIAKHEARPCACCLRKDRLPGEGGLAEEQCLQVQGADWSAMLGRARTCKPIFAYLEAVLQRRNGVGRCHA